MNKDWHIYYAEQQTVSNDVDAKDEGGKMEKYIRSYWLLGLFHVNFILVQLNYFLVELVYTVLE